MVLDTLTFTLFTLALMALPASAAIVAACWLIQLCRA